MAIYIYKYMEYVPWDIQGVGTTRHTGGSTMAIPNIDVDLSSYYTKAQLWSYNSSRVHYSNIIYDGRMHGSSDGTTEVSGRVGPLGASRGTIEGIASVMGFIKAKDHLEGLVSGIATVGAYLHPIYGGVTGDLIKVNHLEEYTPGHGVTFNNDINLGANKLIFGDGDSYIYEDTDDRITIRCNGTDYYGFSSTGMYYGGASTGYWELLLETGTTTNPNIIPNRADLATGIGSNTTSQFSLIAASTEIQRVTSTGILVNHIGELTTSHGVQFDHHICMDSKIDLRAAASAKIFYYATADHHVRIGSGAGNDTMSGNVPNTLIGYHAGYNLTTARGSVHIGAYSAEYSQDGEYSVSIGNYTLNQNISGLQNVAIGYGALRYLKGTANVAIGYLAGQGVLDSTTGNYNVFIGSTAGQVYTTATHNVAIGYSAGLALTTGGSNVFLGTQSFMELSTTSYNVGIGQESGRYNKGTQNVFIGWASGKGVTGAGTTGGYNVGVGYGSLVALTSGTYNVAIGLGASYELTTQNYNMTIGAYAGQYNVGTENVFMGYTAGRGVTGGGSTGEYDVFIGALSGVAITTGSSNLGLGYATLMELTTQSYNVAIGATSGRYNVGTYNAFIGHSSGRGTTGGGSTGSYNVGFGASALRDLTTAQFNVAIGYASFERLSTGGQDVGIGYQSGQYNTGVYNLFLGYASGQGVVDISTGGYNVGVGAETLRDLTTGTNNVAIGYTALADVVSTSYSVGIGYNAGRYSTGANNTFIGASSGAGVNATTTGTNNVFIGYESGKSFTTGSRNLMIGYTVDLTSATTSDQFRLGYTSTYLLQGSFVAASEWVGTSYTFKADHISEYTTSHNIVFNNTLAMSGNVFSFKMGGLGNFIYFNEDGNQSLRIGIAAGNDTMTGSGNVFLGRGAGSLCTSGWDNVAVGANALGYNQDGIHNVAWGSNALNYAATVNYAVGIGYRAGRYQSGESNTFIGYLSGMGVTGGGATGGFNTFIGSRTGEGLSTGTFNLGIGHQSFYELTTGGYNTGLGYYAGRYNNGNSNTFVGGNSGTGVTGGGSTGSYNVFIGAGCGANLTTGTYNLMIGYAVAVPAVDSARTFRLGYSTTYLLEGNMTAASEWVGTSYIFKADHIAEFTGSNGVSIANAVYLTGLSGDDTETYVVAIDNSTGLLSKRAVSSIGGSSVSFGTDYQIPYMNTSDDDFLYSSLFTYTTGVLYVSSAISVGDEGANPWTLYNDNGTGSGNIVAAHSVNMTGTGFNLTWKGGESSSTTATHYGGDIYLLGGVQSGTGGGHGGNIYMYGGSSVSSTRGLIYLGDGSSVCALTVDDAETYVVAIDATTGLLSRRAVSSIGTALTGSTDNTLCTVTGANAIQGEANLTFNGSVLGITGGIDISGVLYGDGLSLPHIIEKTASANVRNSHDAEANSSSSSYVKIKTITLPYGLLGQVRITFDIACGDSQTVYGRVYRNEVALGTEQSTTSLTYVTKTEDITQTWNPGDTCELWIKASGGDTCAVRNFRLSYDNSATIAVTSSNS